MTLKVVKCPCKNKTLHRKLEDGNGFVSDGIFSLAQGRYFLNRLRNGGHMTDTEFAAADEELLAAGLPEFAEYEEGELMGAALQIATSSPIAAAAGEIDRILERGMISPADAERLRTMVAAFAERIAQ